MVVRIVLLRVTKGLILRFFLNITHSATMLLKQLLYCSLLTFPFVLTAGDPPADRSRADVDGPHVFYRGKNTIVKSIERRDTSVIVRTQVYDSRKMAVLNCRIPETGDAFGFKLRDTFIIEPDQYVMPARMLVLSDIEGNFLAFKLMLLGAKVVDEKFNWTFGNGHLVLVGDYFDRGLNVTECLWLIYKLETEAEAAGGKVHFILGNHEILNLEGNTQYVRRKYLENAELLAEDYKRWFDNNSELGRWLRTKNAIEKIGDFVFCHGGISPDLARTGLSISDINRLVRQYLGKPFESIKNPDAKAVYDYKTGIFWYRNIAKYLISNEEVTTILKSVGASKMIVGHTLQPDITTLYEGRVICTDVYHEENIRQGFVKTLWVEDGICYALDNKGMKSSLLHLSK